MNVEITLYDDLFSASPIITFREHYEKVPCLFGGYLSLFVTVTLDSPHKGPVLQNVYPCHEVIMYIVELEPAYWDWGKLTKTTSCGPQKMQSPLLTRDGGRCAKENHTLACRAQTHPLSSASCTKHRSFKFPFALISFPSYSRENILLC